MRKKKKQRSNAVIQKYNIIKRELSCPSYAFLFIELVIYCMYILEKK